MAYQWGVGNMTIPNATIPSVRKFQVLISYDQVTNYSKKAVFLPLIKVMQWFDGGTQDLILVQISVIIQSYNFWAQSIVGHDQLSQIADFGPHVGGFNNLKIKNLKAFLSDTRETTTLSDLPA